jgi:acetyl-CoA acyltransferase
MREAVIVALGRSAIGKAPKGALRYTRPDEFGAEVLKAVLAKVPQLNPADIDDVVLGCATPEGEQGLNMAKCIAGIAGLPEEVSGLTVNRFCASGLQSISIAANSIMVGAADVVVAGGVESMSMIAMGGGRMSPTIQQEVMVENPGMGITAELVAEEYNVSKADQDQFGLESQLKAAKAQAAGYFDAQIIPVTAIRPTTDVDGNVTGTETFMFSKDEGVRPGATIENVAKLKSPFKNGGSVTAANSSQTSDGAAFVVLMSREKAESLGLKPLMKFVSFAVAGVPSKLMGIGPMKAIPKALKLAGLEIKDIDAFELNEAFASQSLACARELGLDMNKVNIDGGAIALGHPLGCTGSFITVKLESILRRTNGKYGVVSMCIGGGMGAAGVFELL